MIIRPAFWYINWILLRKNQESSLKKFINKIMFFLSWSFLFTILFYQLERIQSQSFRNVPDRRGAANLIVRHSASFIHALYNFNHVDDETPFISRE